MTEPVGQAADAGGLVVGEVGQHVDQMRPTPSSAPAAATYQGGGPAPGSASVTKTGYPPNATA